MHKPLHPLKGLQQPHVFFFPLTLQTMAWFWEHRWVHPMAFWILGDILYPSSPLTNNPVEWCNANFARPKRAEAERQAHHEQSPTRQYVERCCCAASGRDFSTEICAFETQGVLYTSYWLKVRHCSMMLYAHFNTFRELNKRIQWACSVGVFRAPLRLPAGICT